MKDDEQFTHWSSSKKEQQQQKYMKNSKEIKGFLTRYILKTWSLCNSERLQKMAFGEKDEHKPQKTILIVGETGVGKSTLINAMVNYMLGVESKDRIWFEVIETKEEQSDYQTHTVMMYNLYTEHCPFSLTVIDTPGFGKTEDSGEDLKTAVNLLEFLRSRESVETLDAACLVVSSSTVRLSERQRYVFNAVLSLFSNDMKKNFVVFITHASRRPTNSIKAIKDAKIPCAQTRDDEPVYFRFDNSHCENFFVRCDSEEETDELIQGFQAAWDLFNTSMDDFLSFVKANKPVSLKNTESVLTHRKQLVEHMISLREQVKAMQLEHEFEECYKEKVPIDPSTGSSKEAMCCSVCKWNCHYPGCWWVRDLSWCTVMSKNKCTECPGKCHYTMHVKEAKIYETKTRLVKKTLEDVKKNHKNESEENKKRLAKEISKQEKEISRLVEECDKCMHVLQQIALKTDALSTLQDLESLCKEAKKMYGKETVQKLEELKKKAEGKSNMTRL